MLNKVIMQNSIDNNAKNTKLYAAKGQRIERSHDNSAVAANDKATA